MEPLKLSVPLPDVLHEIDGDIRVKGHRISLYDIVFASDYHWISPEAMVFYYPTLSYDEIQKVFEFYRANRVAVDEYVAECKARIDQTAAKPAGLAPLSMSNMKRAIEHFDQAEPDIPKIREGIRECQGSEDLREGLSALREKRSPAFKGR